MWPSHPLPDGERRDASAGGIDPVIDPAPPNRVDGTVSPFKRSLPNLVASRQPGAQHPPGTMENYPDARSRLAPTIMGRAVAAQFGGNAAVHGALPIDERDARRQRHGCREIDDFLGHFVSASNVGEVAPCSTDYCSPSVISRRLKLYHFRRHATRSIIKARLLARRFFITRVTDDAPAA